MQGVKIHSSITVDDPVSISLHTALTSPTCLSVPIGFSFEPQSPIIALTVLQSGYGCVGDCKDLS